jgi:aspartate carbamoyltransferase catalytic subunit
MGKVKVKGLQSKDLLGLRDLSLEEMLLIFKTAEGMKDVMRRPVKRAPALLAKQVVSLFFEPSTRTSTSFSMAARMLAAGFTSLSIQASSVKKGESLIDTARNIEAMGADALVIRHNQSGAAHFLAKHTKASVINAGDGQNEHPTQGLLDIFTMLERKKDLKGKKVAIIGDLSHSRVARSNIWGLNKLGAAVWVCGPPTLVPKGIEEMGVKVTHDLAEALADADVVNVLRIQRERMDKGLIPSCEEYTKLYGITADRIKRAKKDLMIMHPGPINRGVEITSEIADGPYNVILDQVTNGVAIRMAVLFLLLSGKNGK